MLRRFACLLAFVSIAAPGAALAQSDTSIDVQTRWPTPGPGHFGFVRDVVTAPHLQLGFGASVEYINRPLVLVDTTDGDREIDGIGHHVTAEFLWALGLFDFLQIGLALPVTLVQAGEGAQPATLSEADELPTTASRDLRFELAFEVLRMFARGETRTAARRGTGILLSLGASLPSGDERAFNGDDGPVFVPALSGALRVGPALLATTIEGRFRRTSQFGLDGVVGSQLGIAGGVSVAMLAQRRLELSAEGRALISLVEDGASPIELMGGARYITDVARDVSVAVRFGVGLTEDITTPAVRGVLEVRYTPSGLDEDNDGIPDSDDRCYADPEDDDDVEDEDGCPDVDNDDDDIPDAIDQCDDQPEDRDGFRDEDGCPEVDNDEDGLADGEDTCRTQPEDRDGFRDDDGCPDPDNDADRRLDADDNCDDQPEDWDEFEDEDGCPDPDNDQDGILDGTDRCPIHPEDRDGHEDTDGCPETDVDGDGIGDAQDRCPDEPEIYNLIDDDDGCRDGPREGMAVSVVRGATGTTASYPLVRTGPRVVWSNDRIVVGGRPPEFARGSDVLPRGLVPLLPAIARLVRGAACHRRVVIEARNEPPAAGRPAPASGASLAARRLDVLMAALQRAGLEPTLVERSDQRVPPGGASWIIRSEGDPTEIPREVCRTGAAPAPPPTAAAAPAPAAPATP